ncbi:MAG TPA: TIGR03032 family protein [Nevskiaceae bacterium]|nr:TIGR03032 family protein [Nevskiaceae bacterium]
MTDTQTPASADGSAGTAAVEPGAVLASEHTSNLTGIFEQLGISLLVTTYQAGKLIAVRREGAALNTHFCAFNKPMGLAADPTRFALGTAREISQYRNMPAVCAKLEPKGAHDACFVPRDAHVTGDIDIHEMAYAKNGELWFVNTRFSCLCTLDGISSFVPRWRPKFVSSLAPEDRCHLNGLGLVDGEPRYVTALGQADKPAGWREHKASGGVLIDIKSGKLLCDDLSMPHSPRWYADQLWLLESGKGTLSRVDPKTGRREVVVTLPGFTRGLDFFGPLAFVGLSQVRETAVFSGIPITEKAGERICGVWVVNILTGQIVGFLRFKSGVQEIFAVSVLPGIRFPEILEPGHELVATSYALPDAALKDVRLSSPRPPSQA